MPIFTSDSTIKTDFTWMETSLQEAASEPDKNMTDDSEPGFTLLLFHCHCYRVRAGKCGNTMEAEVHRV